MKCKIKSIQVEYFKYVNDPDKVRNFLDHLYNVYGIETYDFETTSMNEIEFRYDDEYTDRTVYSVEPGQYIVVLFRRFFILNEDEFRKNFQILKSGIQVKVNI